MPADSADWGDLADAVKAVLDPVTGIGKVENRPGGVFTWIERQRPLQAFWEVDVVSAEERGAGVGTQAFESPIIRIDGFMPWSYSNPDSTAVWRPLVNRVRNRLRTYPTLANAVEGVKVFGLPQVVVNERVPILDGEKQVLVHHVTITLRGERWFTYTTSVTL